MLIKLFVNLAGIAKSSECFQRCMLMEIHLNLVIVYMTLATSVLYKSLANIKKSIIITMLLRYGDGGYKLILMKYSGVFHQNTIRSGFLLITNTNMRLKLLLYNMRASSILRCSCTDPKISFQLWSLSNVKVGTISHKVAAILPILSGDR